MCGKDLVHARACVSLTESDERRCQQLLLAEGQAIHTKPLVLYGRRRRRRWSFSIYF